MSDANKRKFPRIHHVTSKEIIHLDGGQNPRQNMIVTQNVSSAGVKFTTNEMLKEAQYFLIFLNDVLIRNLNKDVKSLIRSGDYYLTKVAWIKKVEEYEDMFDVGAAFIEKQNCSSEDIDVFTELMNAKMLNLLPSFRKKDYSLV